ncbi:hypothetical protein [Acinetobacter sp.]|uniref:hypothetical protein n=1 Tax=Acinetobacter sp. TaxID=472 RepID=UPI003D091EAC
MSKLNFTAQTARKRPIAPMPEKYKESSIRPNIEEGDGIRPHMPLIPLRFLDVKYKDITTEQYVVIPKGRILSAITVQNEVTGDILNIGSKVPVNNEGIATGDSTDVTFTATLVHLPIAGSVAITDGVESFVDDGEGVLTGDATGTGTVSYLTGEVSVTFNAAPAAVSIVADYSYVPEGEIPVGVVSQLDGTTPLYIGSDDSYYGYTRDIAGLVVPANGGTSRTITYDANDTAALVPNASTGAAVSVNGTYLLPANAPIGIAMYDIYQDIRGSFLNYELWKSYGVLAEQHIKLPFVDFGLLRLLAPDVKFVEFVSGSKSGYKVGAATMDATKDAGYVAAENKYSFVYFDSDQNNVAGVSGQLFRSDLFGNWVPAGSAAANSASISLDAAKTAQTIGRMLFVDTRFPKDLLETVETMYGQRVAGTGTEGLPENLYDFIISVLTAGGYVFGTVDPAKVAKEFVQNGVFGYAHIQLMAR